MGGIRQKNSGRRGDHNKVWRDAEYVAVLRDIEPAGTAEFAEAFGVSVEEAHSRLERLYQEDTPPLARKRIEGANVWFLNEPGLDARATTAADEVRRRLGADEDR